MILAEPMTSETQCNTREDRTNDTSRVSDINILYKETRTNWRI